VGHLDQVDATRSKRTSRTPLVSRALKQSALFLHFITDERPSGSVKNAA
jgi:hypothetical protein